MKIPYRWIIKREASKAGYIGPKITKKGITYIYTWIRADKSKLSIRGLDRSASTKIYTLLAKELNLI